MSEADPGYRRSDALVLDASAALALLRDEPEAAAVREIVRQHALIGGKIHAPDLLWLEITNALARRFRLDVSAIVRAVREIDELGVITAAVDRAQLLIALDHAVVHGLTIYDATYLALAQMLDADLLTLDGPLAKAAGARALPRRPSSPRLAEAAASYGSSVAAELARHGDYLARLRSQEAG